jgi:hypothetical protein
MSRSIATVVAAITTAGIGITTGGVAVVAAVGCVLTVNAIPLVG